MKVFHGSITYLTLLFVAVVYFAMSFSLSLLVKRLEKNTAVVS